MKSHSTTILALTELGLNENEAILYEILLKTPEATIPDLQRKSPFSRTMLYHVLDQLEGWGLVYKGKKDKKTTYQAEPPEKLHEIVLDQQKEVERQKRLLQDVLTDLRSSYRLGHNKPGMRFFEGKEGMKEALYDTLTATDVIYTYIDMDAVEKYSKDVNTSYVKKRKHSQVEKRLLAVDTLCAREYFTKAGADFTTVRFLPKGVQPFSTNMQIYDGKISYFTMREDNIMAVIIEDSDIYRMHKAMFEAQWKQAKPHKSSNSIHRASGSAFN